MMAGAAQELRRFGRFNAVGLVGAGLQLSLIWMLMRGFNLSAVVATPLAVEFVVLHNFAWHERFTWRDRRVVETRERLVRPARFHAGNGLISVVGNTVLTYVLVDRFHVPVVAAAMVSIGVCSMVNFVVADRWVYGGVTRAG